MCGPSPTYKRQEVEAVVARQEETIPLLLDILRTILRDPAGYIAEHDEDFAPLYVVAVLAHLRPPQAHDLLVAMCRLPEEQFESLIGGFTTEGMDRILFATSHGRTDGMRALIEDREANGYLRAQAAHALAMAAHHGWAEREEVLDFLAAQLSPEMASPGSYFWNGIGVAMLNLYPRDHVDALFKGIDMGLIESLVFGRDDVRETIAEGPLHYQTFLDEDVARALTPDVHHWIGWWACFKAPPLPSEGPKTTIHQLLQELLEPRSPAPVAPELAPIILDNTSKKKNLKKARKRQRAARKKQRRKKKKR